VPVESPTTERNVPRREVLSWWLYDFANSAFNVMITTVVFGRYFQQFVVEGNVKLGTLLWGTAISASMLLVAVVSPVLGAMADYSAGKKRALLSFTALSVMATAALAIVGPGDVALGMGLFILANFGHSGSLVFYNGFLPEISTDRNVGKVSSIGYAFGYVGGLVCLGICFPLIGYQWATENLGGVRSSFLVTAAFFAAFSVPVLLWLRERQHARATIPLPALAREGFTRLRDTLVHASRLRDLFKFLIAFLIFNDAIETVIYFSPIFATEVLGFGDADVIILFAAVQSSAFVGAWALAALTDRIGTLRMVTATVVVWSLLAGWTYFVTQRSVFWIVALLAGLVLGPCQAASRSAMSQLIPKGRSAEFFGLFAISGKVSAIIGPSVFGWTTYLFSSHRAGVLSTLVFFVIGLAVLSRVDMRRGREAAAAATRLTAA
jgi:UMF1 family MFS transporter